MDQLCIWLAVFLAILATGTALECYVCEDQDSNTDKCIKTTKQCEENEQLCITLVKWGIPPYWTPRGDRIHKISKNCDVRSSCDRQINAAKTTCKRDWYDDWACASCCSGDLCNFYVVLGAGNVQSSLLVLGASLVAACCLRWMIWRPSLADPRVFYACFALYVYKGERIPNPIDAYHWAACSVSIPHLNLNCPFHIIGPRIHHFVDNRCTYWSSFRENRLPFHDSWYCV